MTVDDHLPKKNTMVDPIMMRSGSDGSDNEEHQSIEVVNMDDEEDELLPNVEIDNDFDDNEIKNNFENYA